MFACPTCNFKNHEGALFCEACGTYFHTGGTLATDGLHSESPSQPGLSQLPAITSDTALDSESVLILACETDQRRFVVDARHTTLLLGRNDRKSRLFVDVDLTGESGQAHSVSRRHARVHFLNGRYLLEDLESLNGTYLNGRKLTPYLQEVLHEGDEVKLGSLVLRVSFNKAA